MSQVNFLQAFIGYCFHILTSIPSHNEEKSKKVREFLIDLTMAIEETEIHISENGYTRNDELSHKWLMLVKYNCKELGIEDLSITARTYRKYAFWRNPDEWLSYEESMKLVPKLSELREVCEQTLQKL